LFIENNAKLFYKGLKNLKVSIVLPVYNVEKYLDRCINSIINQSYKNLELIIVNDGSTDASKYICDYYKNKDTRIKVIDQDNSGVSAARNSGIELASGEYIQFVDADDYLEKQMTEKLISSIKMDTQLVICGYKTISRDSNGIRYKKNTVYDNKTYSRDEFISELGNLFYKKLLNTTWNKLYENEIIKRYNICFPENVNMGEDLLFNLDYLNHCKKINLINESLYNYIDYNYNSITSKYINNFFENQQMLFKAVREFLLINGKYELNKDYIETLYTDRIMNCLENIFHNGSGLSKAIKKERIKVIISNDYVKYNNRYFFKGKYQKKLLGILIKNNKIECIYIFYMIKMIARNNFTPIFKIIKKLNK